MKNKLTNIQKISDKQLKFCHKKITHITQKYKQLAQTSFFLIGLKSMSLLLRLYNNWLPSSGWTILIAYLLIKENCTPFSYVNTILCIGHFDAHSPALSWELASNNWTLWLKPMSSAFMPTTFTISQWLWWTSAFNSTMLPFLKFLHLLFTFWSGLKSQS